MPTVRWSIALVRAGKFSAVDSPKFQRGPRVNGVSIFEWVMGESHAFVGLSSPAHGQVHLLRYRTEQWLSRSFHSSACPNRQ
jgi:hypothetical protein